MEIEDQIQRSKIQKRKTAVITGILAGLAFGTVAWGISSFRLMQANAILPWLPFIIGTIPCMIVAVMAALLTVRFSHLLVTPIIWIINGLFFAYMGSHTSFQLLSAALKLLNPDIAARVNYPVNQLVEGRGILLYILIVIISGVVGAFSSLIIENASASITPFGRILSLFIWAAFFCLAGYIVFDNLIQPINEPVVSTNNLIQFALDHEGQAVDIETAQKVHLRAMDSIQDLLHNPRRLLLSTYDEDFTNVTVMVDFGGTWVSCSVIQNLVNFCEKPK